MLCLGSAINTAITTTTTVVVSSYVAQVWYVWVLQFCTYVVPKRCPSAERPRTYLTIYSVFVNDELLCSQLKKTLYGIWPAGALVYASRCSRHGVRVTVFASMAVRGGRGSTALPPVCVSDRVLGWCIDPRVY